MPSSLTRTRLKYLAKIFFVVGQHGYFRESFRECSLGLSVLADCLMSRQKHDR